MSDKCTTHHHAALTERLNKEVAYLRTKIAGFYDGSAIGELKTENERLSLKLDATIEACEQHCVEAKGRVDSIRELLAKARSFIFVCTVNLEPIQSAIEFLKEIDAALKDEK